MAKKKTEKKATSHRERAKRMVAGRRKWLTFVRQLENEGRDLRDFWRTIHKEKDMAKKKKKKKTKKAAGHRKSTKRVAAGNRLVRYNKLVEKIGKSAAHAEVYGGKRRRKGASKKKTGRKGGGRHRQSTGRGNTIFKAALAEVQNRAGTYGWPPTAAELQQAEQIAHFEREAPRGSFTRRSGEDLRRISFHERLAREKQAEAARRVAFKQQQREAERRREAEEEARREVEHEARAL